MPDDASPAIKQTARKQHRTQLLLLQLHNHTFDIQVLRLTITMAPPSKLAIATGVVTRLVKEEASYHKEMAQQEERIKKAETSEGDENAEYTLRQEVHTPILQVLGGRRLTIRSDKHSKRRRMCCQA
jgi:regulator of protease activity HflC (stomatin/prohibitin superfamily)